MSSLKATIQENMKAAMRAREKSKLGTIRLLMAAIKQREVDERIELNDADILQVVDKMVKQRRESIRQFKTANRQDLIDIEQAEIEILQDYLPQALSELEVDDLIAESIAQIKPQGMQDMGKLMGVLKPKMQGRVDMALVSQKIKQRLA